MPRLLSLLTLAFLPTLAVAQRDAKIPDPDPEIERKTFIVAPGFEVNLYAADPLLAKPIQMNFDPQGRLWVASSEIYPQIKPGEKANDKIVILEDSDGDGKADKTTIFADGLLIPTGIEPGDGGAYVANSTEVVHLSASKAGGKADRKRVLLSGFGTEDTHHIIHTFRWGPDCDLYFNQSIYIHSHIETPHGVKRLNAGGIWRFNPQTFQLDVFARGWVNSWGHAFDRWGQSFVTDGAGGEGINHLVPGGYYLTSQGPNAARILQGLNPGSPKDCGLEIISGRHFPDDWQGDCITNDFRGHRVCRYKLQEDGSSFSSREQVEVIRSNHPAFRPIDVKMGPDGALYIADWYNPIIQHGEVDFRDPRRDKTHGRIWRVTAKGRPLVQRPKLVGSSVIELLEHLKDPEDWTRLQAKRVLKEMGRERVLPELDKWLANLPANALHAQLEAAWVYQSFLSENNQLLFNLSRSNEPGVRAAVARILSQIHEFRAHPNILSVLSTMILDDKPRVRLEAVRALVALDQSIPTEDATRAAEIALSALDKPMDRTLDYALWLTIRELEPIWMPAFREGKLSFGGDPKKLAFALNAVGSADSIKPVVALIESGKVALENIQGLWLLLARIGGPVELQKVLDHSADLQMGDDNKYQLVRAVEESVRTRKVGRPASEVSLTKLLQQEKKSAVTRSAKMLVGLWKIESLRSIITSIPSDTSPEELGSAFESIALFGDEPAKQFLISHIDAKQPGKVRESALIALVSLDASKAATLAADYLVNTEPRDSLNGVFAAFLKRKGGSILLAKALSESKLNPDVAKIGLRAVRSAVAADSVTLTDALTKAGGLGLARKDATPEEVRARVVDVATTGDPVRGEQIFRRRELQCLACHGVAGAGGQVGPDLTSIGASAQLDYLVESLLLPNKAIKEGYNTTRIVTADDKVQIGIKIREANGLLFLKTPEDKELSIPIRDIVESNNARSLMPEGLTDSLTRQEFADLARFLSELGKVGSYAPSKARVVRRWQLLDETPANLELARRTRLSAAADPATPFTWSPFYSLVSGDLPLSELPKLVVWNGNSPLAMVRFQVDVTIAGPAKLTFNSTDGLTLFEGTTPVELSPSTPIEYKVGQQIFTLVIDRAKRTENLRIELEDVPNSPARASIIGGK